MNLEDIAKKAGVSRSTVSRVINGAAYVSEKTRERVLEIVEREGFTPNLAARTLVTQRTEMIGIIIPDEFKDVFANEIPFYYSALLQGISEATRERDYATLLWIGQAEDDEETYYRRVLKNRWMDGLIIVASLMSETVLVSTLLKNQTPFVLIGRPMRQKEAISYVSIDNVRAAQQAVKHLLNLGRTRIGALAGNSENADNQDRLEGYILALKSAGIAVDPELIAEGRFRQEWGYYGMKRLLQSGVDSVFAFSDMIAVGAIEAIHEAGLRIPEDIAIVGFDDLPIASQMTPTLTTVRQPIAQKGLQAATLLLDLIEERVSGNTQILLPTQLIIRESCGYQVGEKKEVRP